MSITKIRIPWQYFPTRVYLSSVHSCPKVTQLKSFEDFCWPNASTAKKPRKSRLLWTCLKARKINFRNLTGGFQTVAYLFDGEENWWAVSSFKTRAAFVLTLCLLKDLLCKLNVSGWDLHYDQGYQACFYKVRFFSRKCTSIIKLLKALRK